MIFNSVICFERPKCIIQNARKDIVKIRDFFFSDIYVDCNDLLKISAW